MLDECVFGRVVAQLAIRVAQLLVPCDALLALVVDHVALALDVRVFGRVAQLLVPCDPLLALVIKHVALALDVRVSVFGRVAIPHVPRALEAHASHKVPFNLPPPFFVQFDPLLKTHSAPPTHILSLKLIHMSEVFFEQLANPHLMRAWLGLGYKRNCRCLVYIDRP